MRDPFGNENVDVEPFIIPTYERAVYNKSRINMRHIPKLIFLPNLRIMFKMIRACIGVDNKRDLWFHSSNVLPNEDII